jgi:subtilisin family serine protease
MSSTLRCRRSSLSLLPLLTLLAALPALADGAEIAPWVESELSRSERASVLVRFDTTAELRAALDAAAPLGRRAVVDALRTRARIDQHRVRELLDAAGVSYRPLWIVNAISLDVDRDLLERLRLTPGVTRIVGDPTVYGLAITREDTPGTDGTEWGIRAINADQVWSTDGNRGEGIVVASADTGVEWTHPAIRDQYRGWDGVSASHDYNWYDPIEGLAVPLDDHDHGTHTTGTMVGDDGTGNQVGVAPGASWVGCRNMDHGNGSPTTYLACMEFFIAPFPHGGDPAVDGDPSMAPHVINNSWGCPASEGCDVDTLADGVAAVTAAGILFVGSAGNSGPFCSSVNTPPAIYDDTFSVGSTDSNGGLSIFSSKGPVTVDGSGRIKPDVAAPGGSVRSSVRGGGYASFSGTSMAGPHVAGALALLWSAKPGLVQNHELSRCVMSRAGTPVSVPFLGNCGGLTQNDRPNNLFGYGQIDIYGTLHPTNDADTDGIMGECDCSPADGGVFWAPVEAGDLHADSPTSFAWSDQSDSAGSATVHDVLRGDLGQLRSAGSTADAGCVGEDLGSGTFVDATVPAPGQGFYYLVRAANSCGAVGWGEMTDGTSRDNSSCAN